MISPLTTNDTGSIMLTQVGEYLIFDSNLQLRLQPMLATLTDAPFDDPGWVFEDKFDGFRMIAEIRRGINQDSALAAAQRAAPMQNSAYRCAVRAGGSSLFGAGE